MSKPMFHPDRGLLPWKIWVLFRFMYYSTDLLSIVFLHECRPTWMSIYKRRRDIEVTICIWPSYMNHTFHRLPLPATTHRHLFNFYGMKGVFACTNRTDPPFVYTKKVTDDYSSIRRRKKYLLSSPAFSLYACKPGIFPMQWRSLLRFQRKYSINQRRCGVYLISNPVNWSVRWSYILLTLGEKLPINLSICWSQKLCQTAHTTLI